MAPERLDVTDVNAAERLAVMEKRLADLTAQVQHLAHHVDRLERLRREVANLKVEVEERSEL